MKMVDKITLCALTTIMTCISNAPAADLNLKQLKVSPAVELPSTTQVTAPVVPQPVTLPGDGSAPIQKAPIVLLPQANSPTKKPDANDLPTANAIKDRPTKVEELAESCIIKKPTFDYTSGILTLGGTVTIYGTCLGTSAGYIGDREDRSGGNVLICMDIFDSKNSFALPIAIQSWENTKIVVSASKPRKVRSHLPSNLHKCNLLVFGATVNDIKIEKNQKISDAFFTVHFEP